MDSLRKRPLFNWQLLLFIGAAFLMFGLSAKVTLPEERNFHPVCVHGKAPFDKNGHCIAPKDFVQRRDQCDPGTNKPCYGIGVTSDGWVADYIRNGKCGLTSVTCLPMPFRYATIEYKTNGMKSAVHWQKEQVEQIVKEIEASKKVVVIGFVHGWHHDAREKLGQEYQEADLIDPKKVKAGITQDRNLIFFKHILAKARWDLNRSGMGDYKVLGVYVGWDGGPPSALLNAGDRARAANRIGLSDDFDRDMKAIGKAVTRAGNYDPRNRMLLIGHSFGGRIVSRFMLKNALGKAQDFHPLGRHNMAVTINPAISADSFDAYMKLPKVEDLPGWINITSKEDSATGAIFSLASTPIGRLGGVGIGINDTWFSPSTGTSIGHYAPYQTHKLQICYESPGKSCADYFKDHICDPVKPRVNRSSTNWFAFPQRSGRAACHYICNSYDSNSLKCADDQYLSILSHANINGQPKRIIPGNMWNIITDENAIGPDKQYESVSSISHNAYVQTNLTRMLIDLALKR